MENTYKTSVLLGLSFIISSSFAEETKIVNAPAFQSAHIVYMNQTTGEITSKKPNDTRNLLQLSTAEANAMNHSDEGLVPVTMPDGHVMVDLQGRYQHLSTATYQADGTVETHLCGMKSKKTHTHENNKGEIK